MQHRKDQNEKVTMLHASDAAVNKLLESCGVYKRSRNYE